MTTNILLIRHGQTDWNSSKRWQGHTDTPLNDEGRAEAARLATRLASWPIQAIYTSDLSRAYETAEALGNALNLRPQTDSSLRERNGGILEGLTSEEMRSRHGDLWQKVRTEGAAPPNGESNLEVAQRIVQTYERYRDQHLGQMIVLVSHGGSLRNLISFVLGFPLGQQASMAILENTALSVVRINEYGEQLALFNDSSHLDDVDQRTKRKTKEGQTE